MVLMCLLWIPCFVVCKFVFTDGASFYEGDQCTSEIDGRKGKCLSIYECSWALKIIRSGQKVHNCSFNGKVPIVCCPLNEMRDRYETSSERIRNKGSSSYGELSKKKCEEYYPTTRLRPFVVAAYGGQEALSEEFPHMALLGYGSEAEREWKCGGSLISLRHVLTAAHCLYSRDLGNVKFVRLGELDTGTDKDKADPQDFFVTKAIPHPDYDMTTMQHDIAILELNNEVKITNFVKPACLQVEHQIDLGEITATGWGITEFAGEPSSKLIKVYLKIVGNENCRQQYAKSGSLADIDDTDQICAGSADEKKIMDTCQGDSGGPLQVLNFTNSKHYMIIGVTSFGKACGIVNSAGVYTRVSSHIPWIESVLSDDEM